MRLLIAVLLLAGSVVAQTTITDTIYSPLNGSLFEGRITITAPDLTYNAKTYVRSSREYVVSAGAFSASLIPNDSASPAGTSYVVRYQPNSGSPWTEYWVVASSVTPLKINQVRSSAAPSISTTVSLGQLAAGSQSGQILTWNGTAWVAQSATPAYSAAFSSITSLSIPVATHGFPSANLIIQCYDNSSPGQLIDSGITLDTSTYTVGIGFATAQSGRCVISGNTLGAAPLYAKLFTSATTVVIVANEHQQGSANLVVQCYDTSSPSQQIDGLVTIDPATYQVTVSFAVAQSGRCVVSGR